MTDDEAPISDAAMLVVRQLLAVSHRHSIGISFEPDSDGWTVGYIRGMGGGELARAYDLETAVRAAERPLDDMAERLASNRPED